MPDLTQLVSFLKHSTYNKEIGLFCIRFDKRTVATGYKECCHIIVAVYSVSLPISRSLTLSPCVFLCLIQWITTTMPREKDDTEASYLDPKWLVFKFAYKYL